MFLLEWINEEFFTYLTHDLKDYTFGLFKWNSSYLGYNNGYLSVGMTLDFRNSSIFDIVQQATPKLTGYNLEEHPEWPEE
jgi:hypothetical protein